MVSDISLLIKDCIAGSRWFKNPALLLEAMSAGVLVVGNLSEALPRGREQDGRIDPKSVVA